MAKVSITKEKLDTLAGKIATKSGESTPMTIDEMGTAVDNIQPGGATLQTKSKTYTPTTSQQTEQVTADVGYDGLDKVNVTVNAIPGEYIIPSGDKSITANGNNIDVAAYATVSVNVTGSSKNAQTVQSTTRTTSTSYTKLCGDLTVAKTGTYDIYWCGFRTNTSGTWGTQLYINDSSYGSAQTTYSNNAQNVHLSNVSLTSGQKLSVYGRSRGSSYYACVGQLTIIES